MTEQGNGGTSVGDAIDMAVGTAVAAALVNDGPEKPEDIAARPPNCLNCGAAVRGRYCTDCGQVTDTHVPTLAEVLGDALTSIFNLDSRLWRTLGALFFAPGRLTQDFLEGKRARYVPPLRLYLVLSVLLFLLASLAPDVDTDTDVDIEDTGLAPEEEAALEARIQEQVDAALANVPDATVTAPQQDVDEDPDFSRGVNFEFDDDGNLSLTDAEGTRVDVDEDYDCDGMNLPGFERGGMIDSAVREACVEGRADNFEAMKDAFTDNIPLLAFMVIPVMAIVFKLFYVFSGRNYLAHLVFLCHTHAFTFMVVIVLTLLRMLGAALPALGGAIEVLGWVLLLLYMPAYYFLAMRRVYAQGVLLTLLKQIVLMTAYLFVITLVFSVGFIVVMLVS